LFIRDTLRGVAPSLTSAERTWVLPDEPLPVRFLNTVWADASGLHDDLDARRSLDAWLDAVGLDRRRERTTAEQLAAARELRDAARDLAAQVTAVTDGVTGPPVVDVRRAIAIVNRASARVPRPELALSDGKIRGSERQPASVVTGALATVAGATVDLLGGDDAARLRACRAPGCVVYFVRSHPRREWCSVTCGNRVRAARHYERVRTRRT
jgi:predicted RNA-binding Zn ribbon-like protein